MSRFSIRFFFLNIGHLIDHLMILIFATAALRLVHEWQMDYSDLLPYGTPALVFFGLGALPAGWLADKWSREGMISVFFLGIGAATLLTGFANTPVQISIGLGFVGLFAAIYHPVGLALVVEGRGRTGIPIAVNGVYGNMGLAVAALLTGFMIDTAGWRAAFFVPGAFSIAIGLAWMLFLRGGPVEAPEAAPAARPQAAQGVLLRVFAIIFFTTALGGLVFQSTTFALPKIFDERLTAIAGTASAVGVYTFIVFTVASFAQLVIGWLLDRQPVRQVFAGVAIVQIALFAFMIQAEGLLALFVAVGFMLGVFGQIPINDVLVGRMAKSEWRARAYAARYTVTFAVSASALTVIAVLHAEWGFAGLFVVLTALATAILGGVLLLPKETEVPQPARA